MACSGCICRVRGVFFAFDFNTLGLNGFFVDIIIKLCFIKAAVNGLPFVHFESPVCLKCKNLIFSHIF